MNFYDYENVIQRLTLHYSKENLIEALKIISDFNDYDELRKKLVMAINLYDKEEIAEFRRSATKQFLLEDARLLAFSYKKATLKKYLRLNKKIKLREWLIIDGVKIQSYIEKDAIELAVKIYDDEDTCKEREELTEYLNNILEKE